MKAKIFSNDFNRIVAATKAFASKNTMRALHQYIRLEFYAADSSVTAIAVDGYRMAVEHSVCECDEDFVAYINRNTKLPRGMNATLEVNGGDAIIRCGDCIFGCPQRGGEFLDWKNVLPGGEPTFRFGVNGNYLLSALQAAKISLGNSFKEPVVLEFRGELSPVILRTNGGDIKMVLPTRLKNWKGG